MKVRVRGKRWDRIKLFVLFILILSMLFVSTLFVLSRFRPVFEQKASHAARHKATQIVNSAVNEVFLNSETSDFSEILKDDSGRISAITTDSLSMNKLRSRIALTIQKFSSNTDNSVVYIPLGSLTNFPVLQGIGYRIPVKISFDGVSKVDFDNEFTQTGINQVKHKIFLTATAEFSVISAAMTKSETISAEIPVLETVIVGDVPTYYGDNLSVVGR